jgi:hypothetical protein
MRRHSITYGNGLFVASGYDDSAIASNDGCAWSGHIDQTSETVVQASLAASNLGNQPGKLKH